MEAVGQDSEALRAYRAVRDAVAPWELRVYARRSVRVSQHATELRAQIRGRAWAACHSGITFEVRRLSNPDSARYDW